MNFDFKKLFQLKTYMPGGITGRFFAIVVLPIMLYSILIGYIFYSSHWQAMANQGAILFSGGVVSVAELYETEKIANLVPMAAKNYGLKVEFLPGEQISGRRRVPRYLRSLSIKYVTRFLDKNLNRRYSISADDEGKQVEIRMQYPNGVLSVKSSLRTVFSRSIFIFASWLLGGFVIFAGVAIVFARRQIRSIEDLASLISRAARGEAVKNVSPTGPREVREASVAFFKNYSRMQRNIKAREKMLSGISHDLKTPLTRMRLELEFAEDKALRSSLLEDIGDMMGIIDSYLDYAHGQRPEKREKTDMVDMVRTVVRKLNRGNLPVELDAPDRLLANVSPVSMERAVSNVISNALHYSDKRVYIGIARKSGQVEISVEDNGPGIPEDMREEMLRPFTRLETSRNSDTGGHGLGLSIVQEVMHQHAGEVALLDSRRLGGLRVLLSFPV
ncbi:MAG: ATP-binding protein [Rickettsiales bacterium]|jgi:two-component system osmolarity sensor histidine kinase EnvZ|nr:ATP-binding protein [Rickettsiales bacterium]